MASHRILIVGRSRKADVRLPDRSVSRVHAELAVSARGDLHLADCASANGTWIEVGGTWEPIRQRTILAGDRLRFGQFLLPAAELVARLPATPVGSASAIASSGPASPESPGGVSDAELPRGPVRRNPLTGEIIGD